MGLFWWGGGKGCAPKEPYWYTFLSNILTHIDHIILLPFSYLQDFNLLIFEIFSDEYNLELIYEGIFYGVKND
jgi:hypothetical protein